MKIDSSKIKYNNKYNNKITIISTNNISNNYLKFKRVSSSSTRHIVGNSPVYPSTSSLPDRPIFHLISTRQTFRQTASQTINPPSFQTSSIPLPSPLIPKSIKRNLPTKKNEAEDATHPETRSFLASSITMLAHRPVIKAVFVADRVKKIKEDR